jgi:hypothetical protein
VSLKRSKISKRLVIDTSIARSAGRENATTEVAKQCRDFLNAVLEICHRVIMTEALREEWSKNQSGFAREWYLRMKRQGRKVDWIVVVPNEKLRGRVNKLAKKDLNREAMLKDVLLIEAAQGSDKIIISLDETVRELFSALSGQVGEIGDIIWVNPTHENENCTSWLREGAPSDEARMLGYKED